MTHNQQQAEIIDDSQAQLNNKQDSEQNKKVPHVLMILDGFGINEKTDGNAVKLAKTPNIDKLMKKYPNTIMYTSGLKVGLPDGQMGNSEVGHTNIGAGRIVYQELTKITKSIEDGDFFAIPEFIEAIENCKKHNSKLHILGLLSDGGVHSHIRHLFAILELAKRKDFEDVYVHCFLDGRDTPPASGESYILQLEEKMKEKGFLLSTDGPLNNVLKIKPPMPFNKQNADEMIRFLDIALSEL